MLVRAAAAGSLRSITTSLGFRALLSIRLDTRVATRRVASHRARGSRFARCNSTLRGTSAWLGLFPLA